MMETKQTWIYCRVAHNGLDNADVLTIQQHNLETYAKAHRFEIVGSSNDIGNGQMLDRLDLVEFHAAAEVGGGYSADCEPLPSRLGQWVLSRKICKFAGLSFWNIYPVL